MSRPLTRPLAVAAALLLWSLAAFAQNPNCAQLLDSSTGALPQYSGTLPGSADMAVDADNEWLYVLTQWGVLRANIADPLHPGAMSQLVIGKEGGSNNGGLITITCDCHQGGNTMDVAEGDNGDSRIVTDWQPFKQGAGTPASRPSWPRPAARA